MGRFDFKTRIGQISAIIESRDQDAQAFFNRVMGAGGSLTSTEQSAIIQLVIDMKTAGIWDSMKAIYPMVGASAAACAQNLKSSSFTGTFTSGWTFASTGATPNGTSAYMNSNFIPSTEYLTNNSASMGFYSPTLALDTQIAMGADISGSGINLLNRYYNTGNNYIGRAFVREMMPTTQLSNIGFTFLSTINNTSLKLYFNSSNVYTNTTPENSTLRPNISIYVGGLNGGVQRTSQQFRFAFIGNGLTDTEASNFYTAVQAFQTTLSRQV